MFRFRHHFRILIIALAVPIGSIHFIARSAPLTPSAADPGASHSALPLARGCLGHTSGDEITSTAILETYSEGALCAGARSRFPRWPSPFFGDMDYEPSAPPEPAPADVCEGVAVEPTQNLRAPLDAHPEGTTFCLKPGVYRLTASISPKAGQRLVGDPPRGAILNGSNELLPSQFAKEGAYWVAGGQKQQYGQAGGSCAPAPYTGCNYPEAVFLDDASLWQVTSLSELTPGKFYFDYGNDKIYLADDPTGHKVEVSSTTHAIIGGGSGVVIRGLVVEKFAAPRGTGAAITTIGTSPDWLIENNEVRLNGTGIAMQGPRTRVVGNYVHHQMQVGITGYGGKDIVAESNEIAFNNIAGFEWQWEAAGAKWVRTTGLVASGNYVHHNNGPGLWTDGENVSTTYDSNIVRYNVGRGIFHEISYDAVIRNNEATDTLPGTVSSSLNNRTGYGIFVSESRDVEIYGNKTAFNVSGGIVAVQHNRSDKAGFLGPFEVNNLNVHHNWMRMTVGERVGLVQYVGDASYFSSRGNHFENNYYYMTDPVGGAQFLWRDSLMTPSQWQANGNDTLAIFTSIDSWP